MTLSLIGINDNRMIVGFHDMISCKLHFIGCCIFLLLEHNKVIKELSHKGLQLRHWSLVYERFLEWKIVIEQGFASVLSSQVSVQWAAMTQGVKSSLQKASSSEETVRRHCAHSLSEISPLLSIFIEPLKRTISNMFRLSCLRVSCNCVWWNQL